MTHQELAAAMADVVKDYVRQSVQELRVELKAAPAPDIAPEDIAASVAGLLRKELADLEPAPRTSKRIVRDAQGQIERVIEEPI